MSETTTKTSTATQIDNARNEYRWGRLPNECPTCLHDDGHADYCPRSVVHHRGDLRARASYRGDLR